ncbi:hypothetical protein EJ05DRAFT_504915 [Pseudovirgaria hyperparasitica]|uniref:Uncharacterized protein n=1 Tax=Pseudovirgaria hyperparasitica TaxID=470096 RepID=A0A6A6VT35_9PEZI|nr:uncharacterized protein EJ05DRAFT_504915 [Pseudovirgaria hyperparasitica]KAF2753838.1 hypothetical protein EJ05DRAFT_504915 [Pseudovirgaria hyperparasitica]
MPDQLFPRPYLPRLPSGSIPVLQRISSDNTVNSRPQNIPNPASQWHHYPYPPSPQPVFHDVRQQENIPPQATGHPHSARQYVIYSPDGRPQSRETISPEGAHVTLFEQLQARSETITPTTNPPDLNTTHREIEQNARTDGSALRQLGVPDPRPAIGTGLMDNSTYTSLAHIPHQSRSFQPGTPSTNHADIMSGTPQVIMSAYNRALALARHIGSRQAVDLIEIYSRLDTSSFGPAQLQYLNALFRRLVLNAQALEETAISRAHSFGGLESGQSTERIVQPFSHAPEPSSSSPMSLDDRDEGYSSAGRFELDEYDRETARKEPAEIDGMAVL